VAVTVLTRYKSISMSFCDHFIKIASMILGKLGTEDYNLAATAAMYCLISLLNLL